MLNVLAGIGLLTLASFLLLLGFFLYFKFYHEKEMSGNDGILDPCDYAFENAVKINDPETKTKVGMAIGEACVNGNGAMLVRINNRIDEILKKQKEESV